jgi:hypothetical protein
MSKLSFFIENYLNVNQLTFELKAEMTALASQLA